MLFVTGEYNRDLDAASVAYGDTNVYYDYDGKQMAFKQTLDNQTTSSITHRWIIMNYNRVSSYNTVQTLFKGRLNLIFLIFCDPTPLADSFFF